MVHKCSLFAGARLRGPAHTTNWDWYHQTSLQQELEKRGIEHLVVVGTQTDYCVGTSVLRATTCGYDVTLVSDAHTTEDNDILTAQQVIAYHNDLLNRPRRGTPQSSQAPQTAELWTSGIRVVVPEVAGFLNQRKASNRHCQPLLKEGSSS